MLDSKGISAYSQEKRKNNDNWETPVEEWKRLAQVIDIEQITDAAPVIWDPFYSQGRAENNLQMAFPLATVVHRDYDVFADEAIPVHFDFIVSNPPFSIAMKCVQRLVEIGKPFALLVRSTSLFKVTIYDLIQAGHPITFAMLRRGRVHFINSNTGEQKTPCLFECGWLLYNIPVKSIPQVPTYIFPAQVE